jgi:hypothetical protein
MDELFERAQALIADYDRQTARDAPPGRRDLRRTRPPRLDIDGFRGVYEELERSSTRSTRRAASCSAWTSPTATRLPCAERPHLEHGARSKGRFIPFVRLDLAEDPIGEATRCIDLGARGIKLHPRAQRFLLNDERLEPVFALAAERRVPILIHGGRGLPPIADHLYRLMEAHPEAQLIIAHAGIADLAALANRFSGKAGVFFDTSVWSAIDLLDFHHQVPPEQVVYASDYPYGRQPSSLLIALRTAIQAGLNEEDIRNMLAATPTGSPTASRPSSRPLRAGTAPSRSPWPSRASTSTSRWPRRSSGRASRTRSACSGWR